MPPSAWQTGPSKNGADINRPGRSHVSVYTGRPCQSAGFPLHCKPTHHLSLSRTETLYTHTTHTHTHVRATAMQIRRCRGLPILFESFLVSPPVFLQTLLVFFSLLVLHPGEASVLSERVPTNPSKSCNATLFYNPAAYDSPKLYLHSRVLLRGPLMCSQHKQNSGGLTNRSSLQAEERSPPRRDVSADSVFKVPI